jgi:hypothetical protein
LILEVRSRVCFAKARTGGCVAMGGSSKYIPTCVYMFWICRPIHLLCQIPETSTTLFRFLDPLAERAYGAILEPQKHNRSNIKRLSSSDKNPSFSNAIAERMAAATIAVSPSSPFAFNDDEISNLQSLGVGDESESDEQLEVQIDENVARRK